MNSQFLTDCIQNLNPLKEKNTPSWENLNMFGKVEFKAKWSWLNLNFGEEKDNFVMWWVHEDEIWCCVIKLINTNENNERKADQILNWVI